MALKWTKEKVGRSETWHRSGNYLIQPINGRFQLAVLNADGFVSRNLGDFPYVRDAKVAAESDNN